MNAWVFDKEARNKHWEKTVSSTSGTGQIEWTQ